MMPKRNPPRRRDEQVIEPDLMVVLNAFRRLLQELRLAAGETQARYQVSAAQLFVLDELYEAGRALSIRELAELTMTDRSSVADVVARLVAGGYASRSWSSDDRRRAEIRLTALGEKLARKAPPAPTMRLILALRELPGSDLRALARGMKQLLSSLGISHEKPALMFEDRPRSRAPRSHLMQTGESAAGARNRNSRRSTR